MFSGFTSRCAMPAACAAFSARATAADLGDRRHRHAIAEQRPQRPAVDELLDDVVIAVGGLADFVDDDDVGMVER